MAIMVPKTANITNISTIQTKWSCKVISHSYNLSFDIQKRNSCDTDSGVVLVVEGTLLVLLADKGEKGVKKKRYVHVVFTSNPA